MIFICVCVHLSPGSEVKLTLNTTDTLIILKLKILFYKVTVSGLKYTKQ